MPAVAGQRLQVLSIPLLLPVLYHGYRAWNPGRRRLLHALALFFFAALYPLCGAINAVACLVAAACVLPLLLKTAASLRGGKRVLTVLLPILLAAVADTLALGPWLSDRADLRVYTSQAFLEIKHWNAVPVPLHARDVLEFSRLWVFGGVFLSLYAAVRLGMALDLRSPRLRVATAAVVTAAALISVYNRQLVATADIDAPRGLIELASASPAKGALYVHPYMKWNSMSGVVMIAAARELRRPIVNGYLGICPPYFPYAASVLHRFPDREALWLLWKWKVATVVSLSDEVGGEPECVQKVFENAARQSVWQVGACAGGVRHPSADGTSTLASRTRVSASWSAAGDGGADGLIVAVPRGFVTDAVEIRFGQSAVERIPQAVAVYEVGDGTAARLNDGDSGEWIESLAADALLRRESPVATIRGATRAAFASNGARPPRPRSNGSPSSASPASRRARARGFALGHRRGASCSAGSCPSAQQ